MNTEWFCNMPGSDQISRFYKFGGLQTPHVLLSSGIEDSLVSSLPLFVKCQYLGVDGKRARIANPQLKYNAIESIILGETERESSSDTVS